MKAHMEDYEAPVAPLPPLDSALFDAAAIEGPPHAAGVTLEQATCPACVQKRRKKRVTTQCNKVWGECVQALRPPMPAARILEEDEDMAPPG